MRWFAVLPKGKQEQAGAHRRRQSLSGVASLRVVAASPTTTASDDDGQILASLPQSQAHTGPGSLPFDLFVSILKLAISVESKSDSEVSPTNDIRTLHVINSVCRHWRWTALHSPPLWTYIPPHLPLRLVQIFLRRSADTLLNVDLVYDHFGDPRNPIAGVVGVLRNEDNFLAKLVNILHQAHRIRFLSLSLSAPAVTAIDSELARTGAHCRTPVLEGFRLKNSTDYRLRSPKERFIEDAELSLFIKFRSPVLRELDIEGMVVPCDAIPSMSLSRLSLTLTAGNDAEGYLTNVLSRGSRLVTLNFDLSMNRINFGVGEASAARTPISLPELRRLSVRGTCSQCTSVYRMLSAPSLEEVCLSTGHSTVESAAPFIPPRLTGDLLRVEVGVFIIRLEFSESRSFAHGEKRRFTFTQRCTGKGVSNEYILLNLLKSHHFAEVASIEITTAYAFDSTFMAPFLSHFSALHSLRMHFTGTSEESVFHIEDAISPSMLRSPSSPLHSLRRLTFRNFKVVMPQASPFLIELCAIVRGRGKAGLPDLVPEFEDCRGVTHALLRACGLKAS